MVMGGNSEPITNYVKERHDPTAPLEVVVQLAVAALSHAPDGSTRTLLADDLEAAVLDRTRPRRAFQRLVGTRLERLLGTPPTAEPVPAEPTTAEPTTAAPTSAGPTTPTATPPTPTTETPTG